jgi:1,4-alpha-glucan branching enzyme
MGPYHRGVQRLVKDLNGGYRNEPALYEVDFEPAGFQWTDWSDWEQSVITFCRFSRNRERMLLCACHFTPLAHQGYRVGVPRPGYYREVINTDYGGRDVGSAGGVPSEPMPWHEQPHSVVLTLPPLAALWLIRA